MKINRAMELDHTQNCHGRSSAKTPNARNSVRNPRAPAKPLKSKTLSVRSGNGRNLGLCRMLQVLQKIEGLGGRIWRRREKRFGAAVQREQSEREAGREKQDREYSCRPRERVG